MWVRVRGEEARHEGAVGYFRKTCLENKGAVYGETTVTSRSRLRTSQKHSATSEVRFNVGERVQVVPEGDPLLARDSALEKGSK